MKRPRYFQDLGIVSLWAAEHLIGASSLVWKAVECGGMFAWKTVRYSKYTLLIQDIKRKILEYEVITKHKGLMINVDFSMKLHPQT